MATLADLLNAPSEFVYKDADGKEHTYQLREPTLMECGRYQRWLEQEARAGAARSTELSDDDRRNLLRDVAADVAAQVYAWGGEVCVKSLRTPTGIAKLLSIICEDQGVTFQDAQQMVQQRLYDIAALIGVLMEEDPSGKKLEAVAAKLLLPQTFFSTSLSSCATPPTESPPTLPESAT